MSDDVLERPLYEISLPGTHHSAMYNGGPDWWYCQSKDVYTQLAAGIRYLDFRVGAYDEFGETTFYHHHGGKRSPQPHKWGVSFDDVALPDVRRYLEEVEQQGGSEFILAEFGFFWDSRVFHDDDFEEWQYEQFESLLWEELGEYILDLNELSSAELLELSPEALDGPKIAILYRDHSKQKPDWGGWVSQFKHSMSGKHTPGQEPGGELVSAVTASHTNTSQFGYSSLLVNAGDIENILEGWFSIESNFSDLYEGAERTNALLPGFVDAIKRDPALNPNIISLDYYELSNVVEYCRELSQMGLHSTRNPSDRPYTDGQYRLESVDTGRVATIDSRSDGDGANVQAEDWTDGKHQYFTFEANEDHSYRIANSTSGKVLDAAGYGSDNGDNIHQWEWHGDDNQRWYVVDVDTHPDEYVLVNKHSGLVFDASSGSDGATIHQWMLHNRDNQRWRINDVAKPYDSGDHGTDRDGAGGGGLFGGGGPGFSLPAVAAALGGAGIISRLRSDDSD